MMFCVRPAQSAPKLLRYIFWRRFTEKLEITSAPFATLMKLWIYTKMIIFLN